VSEPAPKNNSGVGIVFHINVTEDTVSLSVPEAVHCRTALGSR
jgi:hypothetical protein